MFAISLINRSWCSICPLVNPCECEEQPLKLTCDRKDLPKIENIQFEICDFISVVSSLNNFKNVTCKTLKIQGRQTELSLELIENLNFINLELVNLENKLLYGIFEIKSYLVTEITIRSFIFEKFDLK